MVVGLPGPFAGQTGLADTRFAGDQHRVRATGERGLPRGKKSLELAPAPDERPGAGQHRGQAGALQGRIGRGRLTTLVGGFQSELENVLRAREIAQLAHPQVGEHDVVGQ